MGAINISISFFLIESLEHTDEEGSTWEKLIIRRMYSKNVVFSVCCASLKRVKVPALFSMISYAIHVSTVANMHLVSLPISAASCVDVFNIFQYSAQPHYIEALC